MYIINECVDVVRKWCVCALSRGIVILLGARGGRGERYSEKIILGRYFFEHRDLTLDMRIFGSECEWSRRWYVLCLHGGSICCREEEGNDGILVYL